MNAENLILEFDSLNNFVIVQPTGQFTMDAPKEWIQALLNDSRFQLGMHQIYDLTRMAPGLPSQKELRAVVHDIKKRDTNTGARIAYVADDGVKFGLLRLFGNLADVYFPRDRKFFKTREEAIAYVTAPGEEAPG